MIIASADTISFPAPAIALILNLAKLLQKKHQAGHLRCQANGTGGPSKKPSRVVNKTPATPQAIVE
jgi:hypothetical protein